jgi:hypothetical protein
MTAPKPQTPFDKAAAAALERYGDIIDMPHPTSRKHPRMPRENRAAQFAPFAALAGYAESIDQAARENARKWE